MRRRRILLLAGCAFAALLVILLWPSPEPSYDGKTLSQWIFVSIQAGHGPSPSQAEAAQAIRAIGTNGLPFLLKWLSYEPGKMHHLGRAIADQLPFDLGESRVADSLLNKGYHHVDAAVVGFMTLGEDASPAIPNLIRIMDSTNAPFSSRRAMEVLSRLSLDALIEAVSDPRHKNRLLIVGLLDSMANSVNGFQPFAALTHCLADSDPNVAERAAVALGTAPLYSETVVPALTEALRSPNRKLRREAANSLANFGPEAHAAIPQIQQTLNDPDRLVRFAATNALLKISPESLPASARQN